MEYLFFGLLMVLFLYLVFEASSYVVSFLWNLFLKFFRGKWVLSFGGLSNFLNDLMDQISNTGLGEIKLHLLLINFVWGFYEEVSSCDELDGDVPLRVLAVQ